MQARLAHVLAILRRHWAWWVVPFVTLLAATLALEWWARGDEVAPIRYGAGDGK